MKIERYELAIAYTRAELLEQIDKGLVDDWQPYGSLAVICENGSTLYVQPMVSYAKEEAL